MNTETKIMHIDNKNSSCDRTRLCDDEVDNANTLSLTFDNLEKVTCTKCKSEMMMKLKR